MPYVGLDCAIQTGPTAAAFDKLEGGEIGYDQSIEHLTGAGGQDSTVFSMISPKGNADTWLQSSSMLAVATKSAVNGLPTAIAQIDGGVLGGKMFKQTTNYINTTKLSCQIGGAVKASYGWLAMGMTTSAVASAAAAKARNLLLLWHGTTVLLNGSTFACQTWESNLENGLKHHTSLDGKTAGVQRMPEAITPGLQKVKFTAEFKTPPTMDLLVDSPATVTLVFTAKNTETSAKTFTHTVAGRPVTMPTKIAAGESEVTWSVECEADHDDATSWSWSLA